MRFDADPSRAAITIDVLCGSVILFHGALVHHGCAYAEANAKSSYVRIRERRRLHAQPKVRSG